MFGKEHHPEYVRKVCNINISFFLFIDNVFRHVNIIPEIFFCN